MSAFIVIAAALSEKTLSLLLTGVPAVVGDTPVLEAGALNVC